MAILEATKTTNIRIPKVWEKGEDGKFTACIPYEKSYGNINIPELPDYIIMLGSNPNNIILYADHNPVIPEGACLSFTKA